MMPMVLAQLNLSRINAANRPKLLHYQRECAKVLRDYWFNRDTIDAILLPPFRKYEVMTRISGLCVAGPWSLSLVNRQMPALRKILRTCMEHQFPYDLRGRPVKRAGQCLKLLRGHRIQPQLKLPMVIAGLMRPDAALLWFPKTRVC